LLSGLVIVVSSILDTSPEATGQQTTATAAEKKDIFKVILTVDGLDHNSGDVAAIVAAIVSVNGELSPDLLAVHYQLKEIIEKIGRTFVLPIVLFCNNVVVVVVL
jgi:hypothetical protein